MISTLVECHGSFGAVTSLCTGILCRLGVSRSKRGMPSNKYGPSILSCTRLRTPPASLTSMPVTVKFPKQFHEHPDGMQGCGVRLLLRRSCASEDWPEQPAFLVTSVLSGSATCFDLDNRRQM